jgi:NADPH-dependent ferric siderophore reductase
MLTLPSDAVAVIDPPAYRPYRAAVTAVRPLSPHFVRVTFTADEFDQFGTAGLDQRVKIVLPLPGIGISDFGSDGENWYSRWRELPDDRRNPFRTYTVRGIRPEARELDVDFVAHPDVAGDPSSAGPASLWLRSASAGDEVVIVGPDARSSQSSIGLDWHPGDATRLLLVGDETAVPAICGILESLSCDRQATAFVEVASPADALDLDLSEGCSIHWIAREDAAHGARLDAAVREWISRHRELIRPVIVADPEQLDDIDVDVDLLWDSPVESHGEFYAWIAGEAAVVKALRRFIVTDTGVDRSRVAFMGYWRAGKSEGQ